MKTILRWCLLGSCMAFASVQAAPILQVNAAGKLTSAKDVLVSAKLYDVEFVDGSCVELFSPCTSSSSFVFRSESDANNASAALLGSVFRNGPLGSFSSDPSLTVGCNSGLITLCDVVTPFGVRIDAQAIHLVVGSLAYHRLRGGRGVWYIFPGDLDLLLDPGHTFARWSAAAVPEPGMFSCFGDRGTGPDFDPAQAPPRENQLLARLRPMKVLSGVVQVAVPAKV